MYIKMNPASLAISVTINLKQFKAHVLLQYFLHKYLMPIFSSIFCKCEPMRR